MFIPLDPVVPILELDSLKTIKRQRKDVPHSITYNKEKQDTKNVSEYLLVRGKYLRYMKGYKHYVMFFPIFLKIPPSS